MNKTKTIFLLCMLVSAVGYGQDCGKKIKKQDLPKQGLVSYFSPQAAPIWFQKVYRDSKPQYNIIVRNTGSPSSVTINGVSIVFEDGTTWEKKDAKVTAQNGFKLSGYDISTVSNLNEEEMVAFATKRMKSYTL